MKVQTSDEEYVGSHLITLHQDVDIEQDSLNSTVLLQQGSERLKDYENITRFGPEGQRTKVDASITLSILVRAPNFARQYAARRVRANATRKVEAQVAAIADVIQEHAQRHGAF
jgi:hypothetical protein